VTSGLWTVQPDRASVGRLPASDIAAFTGRLRGILESQPGVEIVGAASVAPFGGLATTKVHIDTASDPVHLHFNEVDRTYFDALGVHVVAGRFPSAAEPDAGLVNATLATTQWGSEDAALGHLLEVPTDAALRTIRIVGVVPSPKRCLPEWSMRRRSICPCGRGIRPPSCSCEPLQARRSPVWRQA
jgi:hypothetical protein